MVSSVGQSGAFFIFTLIAALGTLFIALVVPETKGKTLDEILSELTGTKACRRPTGGVPPPIKEEDEDVRKPFSL